MTETVGIIEDILEESRTMGEEPSSSRTGERREEARSQEELRKGEDIAGALLR